MHQHLKTLLRIIVDFHTITRKKKVLIDLGNIFKYHRTRFKEYIYIEIWKQRKQQSLLES